MKYVLFGLLSLVLCGQSAFGAVVYQASTVTAAVNVNGNAFDYLGDSAFLAGTERYITQVDLGTKLFGNAGVTPLNLTLELYADMSVVDGLPDDVDGITPGNQYQVLGSSSITQVYVGGGNHTSTFLFPSVLVPNNIVFVVRQDTFDNNFQVLLGNPAAIGDSFQVAGTERIVLSTQSSPNFQRANVGGPEVIATIYANQVPEPGTFVLAALGAIGLVFVARRRSV